jgi:hypothetical protein
MLRLLWVIGILFVMFYLISAMTDYSAATRFGYLVAITIPPWDRHIPADLRGKALFGRWPRLPQEAWSPFWSSWYFES